MSVRYGQGAAGPANGSCLQGNYDDPLPAMLGNSTKLPGMEGGAREGEGDLGGLYMLLGQSC